MQHDAPRLLTASVIADQLGQTVARVNHVLATRRHIEPAAYAGRTRLYRTSAVAQVRHELNAIDAKACRRELATR